MRGLESHDNAERTSEKLTSEDDFAFFAIAGKISSDIMEKAYGGVQNMTEDEKIAWEKEFPFHIQRILIENPNVIEMYTTDPEAAVLFVQNEIKQLHPEDA